MKSQPLPIHVTLRTYVTSRHKVLVDPSAPDGPEAAEVAVAELQRDLLMRPGMNAVATVFDVSETAGDDEDSTINYTPDEDFTFTPGLAERLDIH